MAENSYNSVNCTPPKDDTIEYPSRPTSANKDREDRLRQVRDRQNEERLRKLNEIKQQALQAQKVREQKEEERRRRIDDMRQRDQERRTQVEERKRQIEDVERDRRDYILRKNQEREARLETKRRNDRASSVFAFGSSTPRLLEPADTGGSSFWTNRRATSTTNMMFAGLPLSRRSSERDIDGSKKRATSAGGLDRDLTEDFRMSTSMYEIFHWHTPPYSGEKPAQDDGGGTSNAQFSNQYNNRVARRRTDLMPTIPAPRDSSSLHHAKSFTRSPGRAFSMTRLDQLAQPRVLRTTPELDVVMEHRPISMTRSYPSNALNNILHHKKPGGAVDNNATSLSRSMTHLAGTKPLRKSDTSTSMSHLNIARPSVTPRMNKTERMRRQRLANSPEHNSPSASSGVRSGEATPSRPGSAMSGTSSVASGVTMRRTSGVNTPSRKPRPASIAVTGLSSDTNRKNSISNNDVKNAGSDKPPIPHTRTKSQSGKLERVPSKSALGLKNTASPRTSTKTTPLQSPSTENVGLITSEHLQSNKHSVPNTPKRKTSRQEKEPDVTAKTNGETKTPKNSDCIKNGERGDKDTTQDNNFEQLKKQDQQVKSECPAQPDAQINQINNQILDSKEIINNTGEEKSDAMKEDLGNNQLDQSTQLINSESILTDSMTDSMIASMIAKTRITTEEEAKAALAERRRLAREEAERQAELERQRQEEEERLQAERERQEEEEQRRLEEETLRLAQQQREAEEKRLREAIEEAQRREEEERKKRIEEEKQKAEKEEAERKLREENEKLRIELAAKLEKEEKDREARRKRVEAIMLRTRGRGGNNSAIQTDSSSNNSGVDKAESEEEGSKSGVGFENDDFGVRNGSSPMIVHSNKLNNKNDNNVLREVQLGTESTPIINTRQLSVDNSAVEETTTSKIPLNGSNVLNLFDEHISSNANADNVLINEDSINSNKSVVAEPTSQQPQLTAVPTDLA